MPSVRLDNLRKQFGSVAAIDGVSIEFRDGELTSLLGPSGCGKTTTLNVIAGFTDPDGGSIRFGEQLIADATQGFSVPPNKRNLGMVFQSYALWPHLSVAENVSYGLKMRKVSRAERDEAVKRSLCRVKLDIFGDRFPHELSGGQQQRVAIARALITQPALLLADEPTGNLDSRASIEIMALFEELNRQGITIVVVTHEPDIATHAGRVLAVRDGLLDNDTATRPQSLNGNPTSIWQRPTNGHAAPTRPGQRRRISIARRPPLAAKRRNV